MTTYRIRTPACLVVAGASILLVASGCASPGERAKLVQQSEELRRMTERLEREVARRDGSIADLQRQITHLKAFGPDQPADLFAPIEIEIASLSGGADYDGKPGDDGVTVHLRPRDRDGDVVKVPGRIKIQLLDNTDLNRPRIIGVYEFTDPDELCKAWHGKFGTRHYTLKCPFPPRAAIPDARRLTVSVEFVDYLTGATLTATREVSLSLVDE